MKAKLRKAGRKRKATGWTLFILGLLTVGAALTLLIAVYGPRIEQALNMQPLEHGVLVTGGNGNRYLTYWRYEVADSFPAAQPAPPIDELEAKAFASGLFGHISWARRPPDVSGTVYSNRITTMYAAGWPAHVLHSRSSVVSSNAPGVGWGAPQVEHRPMILSGLIVDVLFWSLATWGFVVLLRQARSLLNRLSRRPGQCIGCGYELVGLVDDAPCPECGKGAETK